MHFKLPSFLHYIYYFLFKYAEDLLSKIESRTKAIYCANQPTIVQKQK